MLPAPPEDGGVVILPNVAYMISTNNNGYAMLPRRLRFDPWSGHVDFVVDKGIGAGFLYVFRILCRIIISLNDPG